MLLTRRELRFYSRDRRLDVGDFRPKEVRRSLTHSLFCSFRRVVCMQEALHTTPESARVIGKLSNAIGVRRPTLLRYKVIALPTRCFVRFTCRDILCLRPDTLQ